jgi:LmbE family N-acetylglucosaminyl deacetylase
MAKKIIFSVLFLIILYAKGYCEQFQHPLFEPALIGDLEPFTKDDRVMILAPHPDDEAIGCAGVIQIARRAGADIRIVYLTNGDHNEFAFIVSEKRIVFRSTGFIYMGQKRQKEAINAMSLLGLKESDLVFLGYPDFGTFRIFKDFWGSKRSYKSILTRITKVPYKGNLSYGAPYQGESILEDLKEVIRIFQPTKVFVSHHADVNVDHKSLYLFLEVALTDLRNDLPRPKIYPYLVHFLGWPLPRHYHPKLPLLPPAPLSAQPISWVKQEISPYYLTKKYQAILKYPSQTQSSAFYLLAFARRNELFGNYPEIDLTGEVIRGGESQVRDWGWLLARIKENLDLSNIFMGPIKSPSPQNEQGGLGVEYAKEGEFLLIRMEKTKELNRRFSTMLYCFGYSYKTPFPAMPKISIFTKHKSFRMFDKDKMIDPAGMTLNFGETEIVLKVPLNLLGDPDFILVSAKTHPRKVPANSVGFVKVKLRKE